MTVLHVYWTRNMDLIYMSLNAEIACLSIWCIMNCFLAFWMHLECTYCKMMQDLGNCIYDRVIRFSKYLKQYSPHGSTKFWFELNAICTWTLLVIAPVDTFFWGVLSSEPCRLQLLWGKCSGLDGFHEQKTEAPWWLAIYRFTKLLLDYVQ